MSYNPPAPVSGLGVPQQTTTPATTTKGQQSVGVDAIDRTRRLRAHPTTTIITTTTTTPTPIPTTAATIASAAAAPTAAHALRNNGKRRSSKGTHSPEVKKTSSIPHMRPLALADNGPVSPLSQDKRRNKLGYHRTSVACGHCRRRKIRCLLAPDDPQGRCANCIRLKKECNFYPVDQPNPSEGKQSTTPKRGSDSAVPSSSTSSSPRASNASGHDFPDDFGYPQSLQPGDGPPGVTMSGEDGGPLDMSHSGVIPPQPPFPYSPHFELGPWTSGYVQTPSDGAPSDSNSSLTYWSGSGGPAGPPISVSSGYFHDRHTSTIPTRPAHDILPSNVGPGGLGSNDTPWTGPPPRSISYSHIEGIPQNYHYRTGPGNANPMHSLQRVNSVHDFSPPQHGQMGHQDGASPYQYTVSPRWNPYAAAGPEGIQAGAVQPIAGQQQWYAADPMVLGAVEEEHGGHGHHGYGVPPF
ncbi:hypothetical protein K490DRAFT_70020 [Saccharata proteae CBS 121410]|uniref:Zn(2)-C6 fungal-type domain-containing protein n=1 Tax=Saccharata proteae CBS 121410 TaxID=1314787 RepID=A0A9P4HKH2_9PEZI|nr:hypothetical protein K490DRAFT_70020 [Saccharata proteae CBS 121410]